MRIHPEKSIIKEWLSVLNTASRGSHYPKLWKRVHRLVSVTERRRVSVNLYKIEKYTKDGDNVIVPGKVLSTGAIKHKIRIAAIEYSEPALKSLKDADCKLVGIKDMLNSNNVKIIV